MRKISLDLDAVQLERELLLLRVTGVLGFAARVPLLLTVVGPDVHAHVFLLSRRLLVQAAMLVPHAAPILYETAPLVGGSWIEVHIQVMELLPSRSVQIDLLLD